MVGKIVGHGISANPGYFYIFLYPTFYWFEITMTSYKLVERHFPGKLQFLWSSLPSPNDLRSCLSSRTWKSRNPMSPNTFSSPARFYPLRSQAQSLSSSATKPSRVSITSHFAMPSFLQCLIIASACAKAFKWFCSGPPIIARYDQYKSTGGRSVAPKALMVLRDIGYMVYWISLRQKEKAPCRAWGCTFNEFVTETFKLFVRGHSTSALQAYDSR